MTMLKWKLVSVLLEIVLILTQDRCMVCVTWVMWKLTSFCLEIVLVSVQDRCMVCARCTVGLQIVLDAPNGATR